MHDALWRPLGSPLGQWHPIWKVLELENIKNYIWFRPSSVKLVWARQEKCDAPLLVEDTLRKQNWKHTDGDSSGEHLLPFPDTSGKSSPAATASMEAAMPALSFWQSKQRVNHNIQIY